jgi:poly(hydroxyalkanoate) depolymerase family esterase
LTLTHSVHLLKANSGHLLVMLHGCVQPASEFAIATRMNEAAEVKGWAVLWPQQSQEAHELRCWNWYLTEHQHRDSGEPAMLAELIRNVRDEHRFERVFLAGISAGAAMSAILAATYPELFAAVALHSGVVFGGAANISQGLALMRSGDANPASLGEHVHEVMADRARVVPTLVLHGGQDAALHPSNGSNLARQWAVANALTLGKPAAVPASHEMSHREEGRYDATIVTYEDVHVEEWRIAPLGHAWSGGSPEATYTDPKGPDATKAVLDFFSRFSRP